MLAKAMSCTSFGNCTHEYNTNESKVQYLRLLFIFGTLKDHKIHTNLESILLKEQQNLYHHSGGVLEQLVQEC